jgi:hypothetical protein
LQAERSACEELQSGVHDARRTAALLQSVVEGARRRLLIVGFAGAD